MVKLFKLFSFLILCSCIGCVHFNVPFLGKSKKEAQDNSQSTSTKVNLESIEFIDRGRIVNAQKLNNGTNIAIIPFKAGIDAEASTELDTISLMIIKGVSDAFAEGETGKHTHFNILLADSTEQADLIVKGRITEMGKPSKFKRWVLFKNRKILSVAGKITDVKTGETILSFVDKETLKGGNDDYKEMGYLVGKNVGRFILSGLE